MTPYSIKPATEADLADIKTLIKEVHINRMGLKWQNFLLVRTETGELAGCGQVKSHGDGSRELASIAVRKKWRHQGIARAIIEMLMAQQGPTLWLTCISPRISLYEKFGFREVKETAVMPPYFRRVSLLFKIYTWFTKKSFYLAVMVWQ